ncbi:hypothetical protein HAX54_015500, partial [Datura stramonium]|nr:hypothetical protein [Datura stramonium]
VTFLPQWTRYGSQKATTANPAVILPVHYDGLRPSPQSRCSGKYTAAVVPQNQ